MKLMRNGGRIVTNLHPAILSHAAFLERPRYRKEFINAIGLIEEKFSVLKERQKFQPATATTRENDPRSRGPSRKSLRLRAPVDVGNVGAPGN